MVNVLLVVTPFIVLILLILILILKRVSVLDAQIGDTTERDKEIQSWIDGKEKQLKDMRGSISEIQDHMDSIIQVINEDIDKKYWLSNLLTERTEEYSKLPDKLQKRDVDYFSFEKKYRGSRDEIKRKQEIFIKYFKGSQNVLDIGCGRGEFLELLKENGIGAQGIDINQDMIDHCKKKGLEVKKADALTYLNSLKDNSLGGVFMGQVIEHLHSKELIALVRLCYDKLNKDAYFVAETVNTLNLVVAASSFHMDLSHTKPVHPETIRFLLNSTGFEEIEFEFLSPVPETEKLRRFEIKEDMDEDEKNRYELMNRNIDMLNGVLFGYQDYAVIAKK